MPCTFLNPSSLPAEPGFPCSPFIPVNPLSPFMPGKPTNPCNRSHVEVRPFHQGIFYNYFTRNAELFIFCMSDYEQVQKVPMWKRL